MNLLTKIWWFYRDGFRSMGLGRTLWAIILIKLIALYTLSQIFFPNDLQTNFATDAERSDHVIMNLTGLPSSSN